MSKKPKTFDELWEELKNDKEYGDQFRFIDRVVNQDKENERLKHQLAEKDKEIERLKVSENWYRENYNDICKRCEDYNKNLRHRIVEQFKEKYRNVANYLTGHCTEAQLIEVLDQIEKGTDNE